MRHQADGEPPGMTWTALSEARPVVGAWVLMYLTKYAGVDRYRAGLYMGPNDWLSAANAVELLHRTGGASLGDADVSHWMPLPDRPEEP